MFLVVLGLNGGNISLLVLSVLLWILSTIMTKIGVVALKKAVHSSQINFQLWSKITYIVLLAIEFLFLLTVLLLWVAFGVISETSNS